MQDILALLRPLGEASLWLLAMECEDTNKGKVYELIRPQERQRTTDPETVAGILGFVAPSLEAQLLPVDQPLEQCRLIEKLWSTKRTDLKLV